MQISFRLFPNVQGKKNLKRLSLLFIFLFPCWAHLQTKTFVAEYTYTVTMADNYTTSRAIALDQVKRILTGEIAVYLQTTVEPALGKDNDFLRALSKEQIRSIIPVVTAMEILEEKQVGGTYYIKASIGFDPEDIVYNIAWITTDGVKVMEFEEADRRADLANARINRLHEETSQEKEAGQLARERDEYTSAANSLSAVDWFQKGHNAVEREDYARGIIFYEKAIELDSNYTYAYNGLGIAYSKAGNENRAIQVYEKAIELNPNLAFVYSNLGNSYSAVGEIDKAIQTYERAIQVDPRYVLSYYNYGNVYLKTGENDKAIQLYKKTIELDPDYVLAYINMGEAYEGKGDNASAITVLEKATELNPRSSLAYVNLGDAYFETDLDKAIPLYQKAIELNPRSPEAYNNLGHAYNKKGECDTAIPLLKKAIALEPKTSAPYTNLGTSYAKKGNTDQAILLYMKAIELNPKDADAYRDLGILYGRQGDRLRQVEYYQKSARLGNKNAQDWLSKNAHTW